MESVTYEQISSEQAWSVFDRASKNILDISGDEFSRRWDAGEFRDETTPEMMEVLILRPSRR